MSFEKEDSVVLHDKHSDFDGETGMITQVVESMFGEPTFTVSFEDGQEVGVPADDLEEVEGDAEDAEGVEDDAADDADEE